MLKATSVGTAAAHRSHAVVAKKEVVRAVSDTSLSDVSFSVWTSLHGSTA